MSARRLVGSLVPLVAVAVGVGYSQRDGWWRVEVLAEETDAAKGQQRVKLSIDPQSMQAKRPQLVILGSGCVCRFRSNGLIVSLLSPSLFARFVC